MQESNSPCYDEYIPRQVEYKGFILYPCCDGEYYFEYNGKSHFGPVWELLEILDGIQKKNEEEFEEE